MDKIVKVTKAILQASLRIGNSQEQKSIIIKDSQQAEFKQGFIFKLQLGGGTPDLSTQSLTIKIDDTKKSKLYVSSQILLQLESGWQ